MKQKLRNGIKGVIAGLGLAAMVATPAFARDSSIEAEGPSFLRPVIEVSGYADDPDGYGDWIGLTFDSNGDGDFDIDDISLRAISVDGGRFRESFNLTSNYSRAGASLLDVMSWDYVVALWDKKRVGCNCEWCDEYNYHLEGRQAITFGP